MTSIISYCKKLEKTTLFSLLFAGSFLLGGALMFITGNVEDSKSLLFSGGFFAITFFFFRSLDKQVDRLRPEQPCVYQKQLLFEKRIKDICSMIDKSTIDPNSSIGIGRIKNLLLEIQSQGSTLETIMPDDKYRLFIDKVGMLLDPYLKFLQAHIVNISTNDEKRVADMLQKVKMLFDNEVEKIEKGKDDVLKIEMNVVDKELDYLLSVELGNKGMEKVKELEEFHLQA